jgi:PadR family transcriptional regulator, regulatory protein AphA
MTPRNPTEFAILGLLAEQPRSGYDIKKEVETRLAHFWSESYGHIYPMLRRLHRRDLVSKTVERQEGRPDRNVYALTADGRRALADWFAEPVPQQRPRNEFLLRLFLGRHAAPELLLRDIRAQRAGMQDAVARLRAVERRIESEAPNNPDRLYWQLVIAYGVTAFDALVGWSETAEAALEEADQRARTVASPPSMPNS